MPAPKKTKSSTRPRGTPARTPETPASKSGPSAKPGKSGTPRGATPPTDTPATTTTPDPIEIPGTQGVKAEPERSKAYGPGGGSPVSTSNESAATAPQDSTPGRSAGSVSTTNTSDIDNPSPTARPGQVDETGSRTSGEAL